MDNFQDDRTLIKISQETIMKRRRQLIKALGYGSVSTTLWVLPSQWTKPLVDSVFVPAHAETSPTSTAPPTTVPPTTVPPTTSTYTVRPRPLCVPSPTWFKKKISPCSDPVWKNTEADL